METVRFGIIGTGFMGGNHARWLHEGNIPGARLAAVCDIDPARLAWAQERFGADLAVYTDYKALLTSGTVDAVLIATPHYLHPVIAIEALSAGLHTLVEKPAGVYTRKVREMNAAAAAHPELVFGMMFNQRMNPLYQKVKELVSSGAIGELRHVNWIITSWYRPQKYYEQSAWRATWVGEGGGVLANQAPHQIDLLQWICGMPCRVNAQLKYGSHRMITVEDDVVATFTYPNGATGVFVTCTHDILGTDRLEIFGNKGKIVIEDSRRASIRILRRPEEDLNATLTFDDVRALVRGTGTGEKLYDETVLDIPDQWGVQHQEVLKNFTEAIRTGTPLIAPGQDGVLGLTLSNAMHLSSWTGGPVDIPFDENVFFELLQQKITQEQEGRA